MYLTNIKNCPKCSKFYSDMRSNPSLTLWVKWLSYEEISKTWKMELHSNKTWYCYNCGSSFTIHELIARGE